MKRITLEKKLIFVVVVGFVLWGIIVSNYYILSSRMNDEILEKEASIVEHQLHLLFNEITQKSNALEYYILAESGTGFEEEFTSFVVTLIDLDEGLTNVSYAPLGTISFIYPYNENAIGRNLYLDLDSEVRDDVLLAEANDAITVTGNFGSGEHFCNGLVFRNPIYDNNIFNGFVNICISYEYIDNYFKNIDSEIFEISLFDQYFESVFNDNEYDEDYYYYYEQASPLIYDWYLGLDVKDSHSQSVSLTRLSFISLSLVIYSLVLVAGLYYYRKSTKLFSEKEKLIYFDKLTSLPNRRKLEENIITLINDETPFHLIFADLDNFKYLNDTYGHTIGDLMLTEISKTFRKSNSRNVEFYRWGGDEFVILYQTIKRSEVVSFIGEINKCFSTPIKIENIQYNLYLSMGISSFPNNGDTIDELIRCGDIAMYKVKEFQEENYLFFEESHMLEFIEEGKIEESINQTPIDEYQVYLQPVTNILTGEAEGYESLLRVFDKNGNPLNTQQVIDLAEKNGTVNKIDLYVFTTVCDYINQLKSFSSDFVIGVNLSVLSLNLNTFNQIKAILKEKNISPKNIIIEVTETSKIIDLNEIINVLNSFREYGFHIALDDFGSGYSSLNYLAHLPITHLKIDKRFIHDYQNPVNMQLLKSIKSLCTSLKLKSIAEGIETTDQLNMVKDMKFDYYQGYYYSKPKPFSEILKKIKKAN